MKSNVILRTLTSAVIILTLGLTCYGGTTAAEPRTAITCVRGNTHVDVAAGGIDAAVAAGNYEEITSAFESARRYPPRSQSPKGIELPSHVLLRDRHLRFNVAAGGGQIGRRQRTDMVRLSVHRAGGSGGGQIG